MKLAPQQIQALDMIQAWLSRTDRDCPQVFRLFGYAGTGKTTLAKYIAEGCREPLFCAFTGKAAYVLRQKGVQAWTIHQLIYSPQERSKKRLQELEGKLVDAELAEDLVLIDNLKVQIKVEHKRLNSPKFALNPDSPIQDADLVIVDEVSMVDRQMAEDLMSFGTKILVLGDPAQLPPVFGQGFFINAKPDFMLTDIHRQARDNPIIRLATDIRNGIYPQVDGKMVICVDDVKADPELVLRQDQVLCGRNATRRGINVRIRELLKRECDLPVEGDRLVCLRNDHDIGLLNGAIWMVESCHDYSGEDKVDLILHSEMDAADNERGSSYVAVEAHKVYFISDEKVELPFWIRKEAQEFDYGYCLTVHKSQGSQWGSVMVFDESEIFGVDRFKHLYTAVTRASDSLKLIIR